MHRSLKYLFPAASEADVNGTHSMGDVGGSKGSDNPIAMNMAEALEQSVSLMVFNVLKPFI